MHGKSHPIIDPVIPQIRSKFTLGLIYAGPQTVYPVQRTGWYIIDRVYNPYGMGIGAHKKWLDVDWHDDMSNHQHISFGYFWCEWLEGEHYSIDYRRGKNWKGGEDWVSWNAWPKDHKSEDNLTQV